MTIALRPDGALAALPVTTRSGAPALVAVTQAGELLLSLEVAPGIVEGRRYPVTALQLACTADAPATLVLEAEGGRSVLIVPDDVGVGELLEFSRALAAAVRDHGCQHASEA